MLRDVTKRANGAGSIYQRKDGRWVAAAIGPQDGRRYNRYLRSKAEARSALVELQARLRRGIAPVQGLTTGRYLATWLEDQRDAVRPSTWTSYEGHVRIHLADLSRVPLSKLGPSEVRRLIRSLLAENLSPSSTAGALTILRMALRQAVRDGILERNVAELVEPPKVARRETPLWSEAELARVVAAAPDLALGNLWVVLAETGLRLGEALGLRWADVDGDLLHVSGAVRPMPRWYRGDGPRLERVEPKSKAGIRPVPLPAAARAAIDRQPSGALFVFVSPSGRPIDPRAASRIFDADQAAAGVRRIRIHDLRHLAASRALARGAGLDDVKRMLGHATIALTSDTYGHLVDGRMRALAAMLDAPVAVPVAVNGGSGGLIHAREARSSI